MEAYGQKDKTAEKAAVKREPQPLILWIAMGALFAVNLALGIVTARQDLRINELSSKLDTRIAAQGETLQKLSQSMEVTAAELQGNAQQAANRIAKTEAEVQRAQQASSTQAKQRKETEEKLASQLGELREVQSATQGTLGSLSTDFSGVKQEVSLTKEEIATTRTEFDRKLQRMVGDLGVQSDLIAHNRTELGELRQLGAREYIEFDLAKAKNPARLGPVSMQLRKTDVKRQKYTLHLIADDRTIEKKDKTANEPVQFYQDGYRQPTEIVVNQIYKDRIVGYVSVPKQRESRGAQAASRSLPPPQPF